MIGILGGTFDPIHYGHLRPADQVLLVLGLDEVRLVPAAIPPHRIAPVAACKHRLRMVELAVAEWPGLHVDDRETRMNGPSYTVRTLESMRVEFGGRQLCLLMGADAFYGLESWYRWEQLLELAHIIVMQRPGWPLPGPAAKLPVWARARVGRDKGQLLDKSTGLIMFHQVDPQDISGSRIRSMIAKGRSVHRLMPNPVWEYIRANQLYGYKA